MTLSREIEGAAILTSHGLLDGLTTVLAALSVGSHVEGNPLMAALLDAGIGWAFGTMLLVVGLVAIAWPTLAEWVPYSRRFAWSISAIGIVIALVNVAVILA